MKMDRQTPTPQGTGSKKRIGSRPSWITLLGVIFFTVVMSLFLIMSMDDFGRTTLTIGPATTFITSPLDGDGLPAYGSYMVAKYRRSDTSPEDNAAVRLLRVLSERSIRGHNLEAVCNHFGINPATNTHLQLKELWDYLDSVGSQKSGAEAYDDLSYCQKNPWSKTDYPEIHQWLEFNSKGLNECAEASRCRYYDEFIYGMYMHKYAPSFVNSKWMIVIYDMLVVRAMLTLGKDDVSGALADAATIAQWCSHLKSSPSITTRWIGIHGTLTLLRLEHQLIVSGKLSERDLGTLRLITSKRAIMPPLASLINESARFDELQTVIDICARGGDGKWNISPDPFLKSINQQVDTILAVIDVPSLRARRSALNSLKPKLRVSQFETLRDTLGGIITPKAKRADRERLRRLESNFESTNYAVELEERYELGMTMSKIAHAVARYRLQTEKYPESIGDLVPDFLNEIPIDPLSEMPFVYQQSENKDRFVIYSLGLNQKDDGGKSNEQLNADDVSYGTLQITQ
jgi:hypothetical protein